MSHESDAAGFRKAADMIEASRLDAATFAQRCLLVMPQIPSEPDGQTMDAARQMSDWNMSNAEFVAFIRHLADEMDKEKPNSTEG